MPFLYIGLGAAVLSFVIYVALITHQKKISDTIKQDTQKTLLKYGELKHEHRYDLLKLEDGTYHILYVYVPQNAELTINSKTIWEIRDASKSKLLNQQHFLSSPYPKIVIVYPASQVIKRYINENELEFVKYNKMFYNIYVIRHFELDSLLKELKDA